MKHGTVTNTRLAEKFSPIVQDQRSDFANVCVNLVWRWGQVIDELEVFLQLGQLEKYMFGAMNLVTISV